MSREIDFSKPLSDEDMAYVRDRPWLIQDAEMRGLKVESEIDFTVDDEEVDTSAAGVIPEQVEAAPRHDTTEDSEDGDEPDEDEADEDDEEAGDYDTWDYADLKEEAGNRGLSKSGSKEQLVERLLADDAESDEDDSE